MALTGKFRFRKSLWGKVVLQVEEEVQPFWCRSGTGGLKRRWRNASAMDFAASEMRPLLDMRSRPELRFQSSFAPNSTFAQRERDEAHVEIETRAPLSNSEVRRNAGPSPITPAQNPPHAASDCESEVEFSKLKKRSRTRPRKGRTSANGRAPLNTTQPLSNGHGGGDGQPEGEVQGR